MLRSFMIISARGGIVLFRKVFVKGVDRPRLFAGLLTALCDRSAHAIGVPVSYVELDTVAITVAEVRAGGGGGSGAGGAEAGGSAGGVAGPGVAEERLRCVVFHDAADGELYGRLIAEQLLAAFVDAHSERLAALSLASTDGVEDLFKAFNSRVRHALQGVVHPLMERLQRERGIHRVILLRHRRGAFSHAPDSFVWYSSSRSGASAVADVQAVLKLADDVLVARADQASVVLLGERVRVERLSMATLVVATAPPDTCAGLQSVIDACAATLQRFFSLMPP